MSIDPVWVAPATALATTIIQVVSQWGIAARYSPAKQSASSPASTPQPISTQRTSRAWAFRLLIGGVGSLGPALALAWLFGRGAPFSMLEAGFIAVSSAFLVLNLGITGWWLRQLRATRAIP